MNDGTLQKKSLDFAISIVQFYRWLTNEKKEFVMSKQILRSGTSIEANIHEAGYAASKPDFVNKLQIALKETAETEYWLIVLRKTDLYEDSFESLVRDLNEIKKMLISSINTAKRTIH